MNMMRMPYDNRLEPIDEKLVQLIAKRNRLSKGTNGMPTLEQYERWSKEYKIDPSLLAPVFAAMHNPRRFPRFPVSPQHLQKIVPIMRKVEKDSITYQITRMEQYEECSLVHVDMFAPEDYDTFEFDVQLTLAVSSDKEYEVQMHHGHSGTNQASYAYTVIPKLRDDLDEYHFQLKPYPQHSRSHPPQRILNQEVDFESV